MFSLVTSLLLDIRLRTTLSSLALIVNLAVLLLLGPITCDSSADAAQSALRAVRVALAQILQLALGFLRLAALVLLSAGLTQVLVSNYVASEFFGGANGLVPFAAGAVLVVLHGGSRVGVCGDGTELCGGVGGFVLGLRLLLGGFALGLEDDVVSDFLFLLKVSSKYRGVTSLTYLVSVATSQRAQRALDGASRGVNVGLESRRGSSVVRRHFGIRYC